MPTSQRTVRERLVMAAFALFEERGFEDTTVDAIAQRAGVGRTTFFRTFRSKESVIFPDHDVLLGRIEERLIASSPNTRSVAVTEAARLVLLHYLAEGEVARARYRLTSAIPSLRNREIAGIGRYQRLFAGYLAQWWAAEPNGDLQAEVMAAAVVTAHNHVLRRWLRNESDDPEAEFTRAMGLVVDRYAPATDEPSFIVIRASSDPHSTAARLQQLLSED